MDGCLANPHGTEHYWLVVDSFHVCLLCEAEEPIRPVETLTVKGVYL